MNLCVCVCVFFQLVQLAPLNSLNSKPNKNNGTLASTIFFVLHCFKQKKKNAKNTSIGEIDFFN